MRFTFVRWCAILVSIDTAQIWVVEAASVLDETCFRCDEIAPCLEPQYICNSVPECANGRDEQTTEGGGCYTATDDSKSKDSHLSPLIYALAGFITLETLAILATVMYLLKVRCCQFECKRESREKPECIRSTRSNGPVKPSRSQRHAGREPHFYTKPRDAVRPARPLSELPILGINGRPVFESIGPPTVQTALRGHRCDSMNKLRPDSDRPIIDSPSRLPFQSSGPMDIPPIKTVTGRSTDEHNLKKGQLCREIDGKMPPQTISAISGYCNRSSSGSEHRPVVHHHHTTVNHLTLIVPGQTEAPGRLLGAAAARTATITEITDDQPWTSDGRTASGSGRQLVPMHRSRKGNSMYDVGNLY
ncbi:uncharacterized protein LOC110984773 [Acanthaster planci]|uniref:Uncharacterized protein LOC110984773 n=1 Tax=Acanthaster planci TaxID=133434 RepID=A0A8B7Z5N8_ACAPL|nr:uncharacterized protein LOC110984773 [Acanthaster planci]